MEHKDWNYKTYLGDCIDGMRLLPAGSVDFLFHGSAVWANQLQVGHAD